MGLASLTDNTSPVEYAISTSAKPLVDVGPNFNRMTVAELRNRLNPVSKYYDSYNAKAFLEDPNMSFDEKFKVLFGSPTTVDALKAIVSTLK